MLPGRILIPRGILYKSCEKLLGGELTIVGSTYYNSDISFLENFKRQERERERERESKRELIPPTYY
jgi:hypothetical protein